MANRIGINPMCRDFYVVAKTVIDELSAQYGATAYEQLFTQKTALSPGTRRSSSHGFLT
jgi:hypothetical protein